MQGAASAVKRARARLLPTSLMKIDGKDVVVEFRGYPAALPFELGGKHGNIVVSTKSVSVLKGWRGKKMKCFQALCAACVSRGAWLVMYICL